MASIETYISSELLGVGSDIGSIVGALYRRFLGIDDCDYRGILGSYNYVIDGDHTGNGVITPGVFDTLYSMWLGGASRRVLGSYRTPDCVVRFMVREVLREYLRGCVGVGASSEDIVRSLLCIRVLDISCGTGIFLVGMLRELVRILREYDPDNRILLEVVGSDDLCHTGDYLRRLHIIRNCLYGIDIEPVAIYIAKLRLLLSLAVDGDRIDFDVSSMDRNYVVGDALIRGLFDSDRGIGSGYDIVIGNPPYVPLQRDIRGGIRYGDVYKDQGYEVYDRLGDIYCLFYERGIELLRDGGHICYITSNMWMYSEYGRLLRSLFMRHEPKLIVELGEKAFPDAGVNTCILLLQKLAYRSSGSGYKLSGLSLVGSNVEDLDSCVGSNCVEMANLREVGCYIGSGAELGLMEKIECLGKPLKDWEVNIYRGITTGLNDAFIITTERRDEILAGCNDNDELERTAGVIKPVLRGRDIKRYYYEWAGLWVIGTFPALHLNIDDYPSLKKYFLDNFDIRQLEQSGKKYPEFGFDARKKTGNKWFETQDQIAYYPEFEKAKIIFPIVSHSLRCAIDPYKFYLNKVYFIDTDSKYLLALLNSSLIGFYYKKISPSLGNGLHNAFKIHIEQLPIIVDNNSDISQRISELVEHILVAKREDRYSETGDWEREIDYWVYKLYDLTLGEIDMIER